MANPYAPPQAVVGDVVTSGGTLPADRGTRLGAVFLDGLIGAGLTIVPAIAGIAVASAVARGQSDFAWAFSMVPALGGVVIWAWLTIKYVKQNGQTIAKKILGIKVIRADGTPASLGRIFWLRNVVNGLLGVIPLYGLIEVLFIFGDGRQCLHDKIADTIVVRA
jgi:uncharacterized RDD family membrane protein YckC